MLSNSADWLERLSLATASLEAMTRAGSPDVSQSLGVHASERRLGFGLPFWVNGMHAEDLGEAWPLFCQALSESGCLVSNPIRDLAELPTNAIPTRLSVRHTGTSLHSLEVATADAIVLSQQDVVAARWGQLAEVSLGGIGNETPKRMAGLIRSLRIAAGGNTPVGLSLPVGGDSTDVIAASDAGCDFLLLEEHQHAERGSVAPETILGVANVRRILNAQGQSSMPIVLSARVGNVDEAIKLLALGADFVSIEAMLREAMPLDDQKEARESAGRLSSLVSISSDDNSAVQRMQPVVECLSGLKSQLEAAMNLTGASTLHEFDASKITALDSQIAELCGLAVYGAPSS
ncbi:MAG: hypothetical protein ACE361_09380 [Aureliella sp.]